MITLKIADPKLARWLCAFTSLPKRGAILVIAGGGNAFVWPIDPEAWKR